VIKSEGVSASDEENAQPIEEKPTSFRSHSSASNIVKQQVIIPIQTKKNAFIQLPGEILVEVADMLGERLPLFMFTNRISFKVTLQA